MRRRMGCRPRRGSSADVAKRMSLRVVLQSEETLGYVAREGGWTADVRRAIDFGGVIEAMDYALSHGLRGVRTVLKCEDPQLDLPLPSLRSES